MELPFSGEVPCFILWARGYIPGYGESHWQGHDDEFE